MPSGPMSKLLLGVGAVVAVLSASAAPTSAQSECRECEVQSNHNPGPGWLCSPQDPQGNPEECHIHKSTLGDIYNFHPMGHPIGVWLDDSCHNLCDLLGPMIQVALETDERMHLGALSPREVVAVYAENEDILVDFDPSAAFVTIQRSDSNGGQVVLVPVPSRWIATLEAESQRD
jgi:hypothetical protein